MIQINSFQSQNHTINYLNQQIQLQIQSAVFKFKLNKELFKTAIIIQFVIVHLLLRQQIGIPR